MQSAADVTTEQNAEHNVKALEDYIRTEMRHKKISQCSVAEHLNMTRGGFNLALSRMSFNCRRLIILLNYIGADMEKISKLISF